MTNNCLTPADKKRLRAYWKKTYAAVQIRQNGEVWAKKSLTGSFGLLETTTSALESAKALRPAP